MVIESKNTDLSLLDGRNKHNNGWFVVRSLVAEGRHQKCNRMGLLLPMSSMTGNINRFVHVSQIGYLPNQQKVAVIELDGKDSMAVEAKLMRVSETGRAGTGHERHSQIMGKFLRYNYFISILVQLSAKGFYLIQYGDSKTEPFRISTEVFKRGVWQPILEYFLPIQMCHMRVTRNIRYGMACVTWTMH